MSHNLVYVPIRGGMLYELIIVKDRVLHNQVHVRGTCRMLHSLISHKSAVQGVYKLYEPWCD